MHDTLAPAKQSDAATTQRPGLITKLFCGAATAQCLYVVWLLAHSQSPTLNRSEALHLVTAAVLGFPALYLLARDLMSCPRAKNTVGAFRVGVAVGKLRRR
ncbi:hypothetical protein [Micromonospora sp. NPDC023633]|uniref:hypothetical protein n=1 Tax=Micromonospora sp. NPDC023633 TaxID=3154320 RepID=UPI0033E86815